jgi:hypothetical protein
MKLINFRHINIINVYFIMKQNGENEKKNQIQLIESD